LERDTFLVVGLVLLIAGVVFFLAFNPTFTSFSKRLNGYETPRLSESDFMLYTTLSTVVMPIITLFIAIGITFLLLGTYPREKK